MLDPKYMDEFPIRALPESLQVVVREIAMQSQAPLAIIYASVMSAIALAYQHLFDVSPRDGQVYPLSQYYLTIADTGERKTSLDRLIFNGIRQFLVDEAERQKKEVIAYEAALLVHKELKKGILKEIKRNVLDDDITASLQEKLAHHLAGVPIKPSMPKLIFSDTSVEELLYQFHIERPFGLLLSDEASGILNNRVLSSLSVYNSLWSGTDMPVDRRTSESFVVRSPRLSASLSIQGPIFAKIRKKREDELRGMGFLARCWVSEPLSTQGWRELADHVQPLVHLQEFNARIVSMIKRSMEQTGTREVLKFSIEARHCWTDEFNRIERSLRPQGEMADIKDFASKHGEGIARKAALFHLYSGETGDISLATLSAAINVAGWYARQYKRLFRAPVVLPQKYQDARDLQNWFLKKYAQYGVYQVPRSEARNNCPNHLREKGGDRFYQALDLLQEQGGIQIVPFRNPQKIHYTTLMVLLSTVVPSLVFTS